MHASLARVEKPELLIIDSKSLRQDGITHLLEMWADVLGLTVKSGDGPLETRCAPANCAMIIISVGNASIKDTKHQALLKSVRGLMPQVPLLIISDREDAQEIAAAFHAGAVGFMPTSIERAVAFQALSFIRNGGWFYPRSVLSTCLREVTLKGLVGTPDLTIKQVEVCLLLRQGYSNKTIARQLGMSEATVKVHARRIMHKFGVANRTQLAVAAINQSSLRVPVNGHG